MKRPCNLLFTLSCLLAAPLVAQPAIGGNTCDSADLTGTYAFTLSGRQITSAGNLSNVILGNGSATFDGLNKVTITTTADTLQSIGTPLTWGGSFTVQSNCAGTVTITSGGSVTLNLMLYNQGVSFLATGTDAIYSYMASGTTQATGCSAATLSGVYVFTSNGYSLAPGVVNGTAAASGLFQFDGVSNLTVNASVAGTKTPTLTLTGSYSVSSTCVGSATVTDSKGDTVAMSFSIYNASAANGGFDVVLAQSGSLEVSGSAHVVYGQPAPAAANQGVGDPPAGGILAKLSLEAANGGKI